MTEKKEQKAMTTDELQAKLEEAEQAKDKDFADKYKALCAECKRELVAQVVIEAGQPPNINYMVRRVRG